MLTTLGIALLMFSLCRLFFLLFNLTYFRDFSVLVFFHGLRFDLAALVIVFSPYIFLHLLPHPWRSNRYFLGGMKGLFHSLNTTAMAFNCMDIEYFKFTFKRTTFDFFDLVGYGQDVYILMPRFLSDYWYVIALWLGMVLLTEWLYRRVNREGNGITGTMAYLREAVLLLLVVPLSVLVARGGWQLKPLSIIHAGAHTEARNVPLVLNTPFTLLNTWNKQQLADRQYFPEAEAKQRFNPVIRLEHEAPFDRKNVVLIILESFSREYIGSLNNYPGYTPFLDSLIGESLVFNQCYANGKKSIEGVPSILAGLPSLMNNPYISSIYSANTVNSLASLLKAEGYQTAFYHGGTNGTMGFDNFAAAAGFDRYVGRAEYNNEDHYDGNWGIFDEPFLQFFAEEMDATETPFFTTFFSLSSHHPFTIPEEHRGKFAEGPLPILKTVRYADYSLREFFRTARTQSWYANTLFVITADHTAEPIYPHYNTAVGNYAVPLIFFTPSGALR
ncbi:MAG: sulfatase-like hydrolase/transferase, partial [Bacteroidota bacterium]